MASLRRMALLAPAAALLYGLGAWGATSDVGVVRAVLPWLAVLLFVLVFVAGWLGIPILGALSTVLVAELPPRWQRRVKRAFVAWLLAWIGVAVGLWLWRTPFDFV